MIQTFQATFPPQNSPIIDQQGTVLTPWMAFFRALFLRTGAGTGLPDQVNLTASASANITADWNVITDFHVASTLPSLTGGQVVVVQNSGGGIATINAPAGAKIDGASSYSLPDTKMQIFWFFSATQIFSTQLG